MPASGNRAQENRVERGNARIAFDPGRWGIARDVHAVLIQSTDDAGAFRQTTPMQPAGSGRFEFSGELPVGDFLHRFVVISYDPDGTPHIDVVPRGGTENALRQSISGSPASAPDTQPAQQNSRTETGRASGDVSRMRLVFERAVDTVFRGGELSHAARKEAGVEAPAATLARLSEYIETNAAGADESVRQRLRVNLGHAIEARHAGAIDARGILTPHQKNQLKRPEGRAAFRLSTFNSLSENGGLGLRPRQQIREWLPEPQARARMEKLLGVNYATFDRICSRYDAGALRAGLDAVLESHGNRVAGFSGRAKARANLAARVEASQKEVKEPSWMRKFLSVGGDLALKYGALGLIFTNPWIALALWNAKGLTEAAGFDFGAAVAHFGKVPLKILEAGIKTALANVPDDRVRRIAPGVAEWAQTPVEASDEKLGRAKLTLGTRMRLLARGLIPAADVLQHVPKVGAILEKGVDLGQAAQERFSQEEKAVDDACKAALASSPPPSAHSATNVAFSPA